MKKCFYPLIPLVFFIPVLLGWDLHQHFLVSFSPLMGAGVAEMGWNCMFSFFPCVRLELAGVGRFLTPLPLTPRPPEAY